MRLEALGRIQAAMDVRLEGRATARTGPIVPTGIVLCPDKPRQAAWLGPLAFFGMPLRLDCIEIVAGVVGKWRPDAGNNDRHQARAQGERRDMQAALHRPV